MNQPGHNLTTEPEAEPDDRQSAAMKARWRPLVFALLIVALVLRLIAASAVERHVQQQGRSFLIEGDANGYWELAEKIAAGAEYSIHQPPRRILRTPGFPLWLAGSIRLFGSNVFAARCTLAVAGTFACWLVYEFGRRVHMRRTGFWAALLLAVHPLQIVSSVMILSETLFTVGMLGSLIALQVLVNRPPPRATETAEATSDRRWIAAAIVGALISLTILVRPGFLPWLIVAVAAVLVWACGTLKRRMLLAVVLLLGSFVTLLPWAARNAHVSGHWVFTSLWSGPSLYDGLNPAADGTSNMAFFDEEQLMQRSGISEFEMNAHYRDRALRFAMQRPVRTAWLAGQKAILFLSPVPRSPSQLSWAIRGTCVVFYSLVFGFAAMGLWSRQWQWFDLLTMVGPFLLFLLIHMVFVGSVRYRLPVEFPLSVLAAIGWRHAVLNRSTPIKG